MAEPISSLYKQYSKKYDIPVFLISSCLLLILGLFLPCIRLEELVFWKSTFSIVTGIFNLFKEGHHILGIIIILFSILFPLFKLFVLFIVWFRPLQDKRRKAYIGWLGVLGKWSMLDVFVVAMTIVITKISKFANAEPKVGIYFFCGSIMLTMLTTERIEKLLEKEKSDLGIQPLQTSQE